jgi:hypothetical protein
LDFLHSSGRITISCFVSIPLWPQIGMLLDRHPDTFIEAGAELSGD